jgi:hypothetical protein
MRKRTRIAVVVAALLLAVVAPTVTAADNRQVAEASTLDWRAAVRALDSIIPRTGDLRNGKSAFLTVPERWQLAKVACTVNQRHDQVHKFESAADSLLGQVDLADLSPYRFQSPVLELSRRLHRFKQDAGPVYGYGSKAFCDLAEYNVKLHASTRTW